VNSAVDVSSSVLYRLTIRIRSDDTIRQNTNTLFGPLFGTEANTKRIFGTSLLVSDTDRLELSADRPHTQLDLSNSR